MSKPTKDEGAFEQFFREAKRTARRLEIQTKYGVEQEDEAYRKFMEGKDPGLDFLRQWLDFVSEQTSLGKRIERVRVVDDPPIDYMKFETAYAPHNIRAGEDIRYLSRTVANELDLPKDDYWLFDDTRLILECFDERDGWYLGFCRVEDSSTIRRYAEHLEEAWRRALTFDQYSQVGPDN